MLISPVLAALAVAIGVPILLFYVYGVVPGESLIVVAYGQFAVWLYFLTKKFFLIKIQFIHIFSSFIVSRRLRSVNDT